MSVSENLDSAKWLSRDLSARIRFFKTTMDVRGRKTVKTIVADLYGKGHKPSEILKITHHRYGVKVSRMTIYRFLNRFRKEGEEAFARRAHVRRVKNDKRIKLVATHKKFIEYYIRKQPDITASTLCEKLKDRFWISVSARTVRRLRKTMGFVRKRARYCQLISAKNQKVSLPLHLYNNIRNQFDNYK